MTPAVENTGNDHTGHSVGRFSSNGQYQICSPRWFSDSMKPGCCSPSQQATTPIMKAICTEAGDLAVAKSKETSSLPLPHWMDPTRVPGRIAETGPKPETPSPGPSTPMQAPPLPQQKLQPRETPEPYPMVPNATSIALSLQHTKNVWGSQSLSRPIHPSSALSQDPVQSQKENALFSSSPNLHMHQRSQASQKGLAPLLSSHHRVGHPPLSRALATLGTPKTSLLNDELQLHLHSKPTQSDDQTRFLGLDGDRFVTPKGHPISNAKSEAHELSVDAGLSLGFNPLHHSGLIKTPLGRVTRKWEDDCRNGSHTGPSFAPKTPNEGIVFLQLRQGAATDEDSQDRWDQGIGKPVNSQYNKHQDLSHQSGEVERSPSQVQEHFLALRAEHITNPFPVLSHERSKKRMKRRPLDQAIASYETRELNLPINDKDNERNGNFLADNEDSGSSHPLNGSAKIPPECSKEKVLDKVLAKILDLPEPEPKTMVVKKTPKRVHNSNPSFLLSRTEASVLENVDAGQVKSPVLPHMMFTPSSAAGTNGKIMAVDLSNSTISHKVTESSMGLLGGETVLESRPYAQESVLWQPPPGSKLFTVPAYSPMPTSSQTFSMGEPSLPLTLNFSPRPLGLLISSPKTSTGIASTEEEWGKSLALSATPATSPTEMESSTSEPKLLTYQERFVQLQAFLKKCDEDDQSDLFHALGSLSAVARSGHAVSLENRAMWLSIEEGKEMSRVKSLNIMGRGTNSRGQNELGCTPQGLRLPAFSTPTDLVQQQSLGNSKSPPQMRMLMSGDTPTLVNMTTPNFV